MKRLQSIEAEMLKEFIEFCKKNSIAYFLIGGSALGAVRHQGFIPWDDDIDIGIPRPDYDRLINIPENDLPDGLIINSMYNENEYPYYFAKVCNENIIMIEEVTKHLDFRHCLYIDIFPLDGAPNSRLMQKYHLFVIRIFKKLQNINHGMIKNHMNYGKKVLIKLVKLLFSRKMIYNILDRLANKYKYDNCDIIGNYFGSWGIKEIVPKKYFGDGTIMFFENGNYRIPTDYDNYLKSLYGNYLELPPEEKRKSHHSFTHIEFNKH